VGPRAGLDEVVKKRTNIILCKDGSPTTCSITINLIIMVSPKIVDDECMSGTHVYSRHTVDGFL